ncbi:MAG: transcriptional regulator [Flavipsychrobacter sp.]|jgi:DNA-binding response OmpR family regulator|nr:transcriptional regulator [Flavipsychrobacter sp.]
MKVLVAEDDSLIQKTVELKLKKEGFEVICCNDGKEALEKIEEHMPDIVLTDMMMPYASGLEIVAKVKSITSKKIPVIVFSTMGQENIVEEAFALGADDYVTKPFSLTELTIRIKRQLKR